MKKRPPSVIYKNNAIGENVSLGHYILIRHNNKIGNNVRIGSFTEIAHDVNIEDRVQIHSKCFIPEYTVLRKGCWIGPCVTFVNDLYPQTEKKFMKGVEVGEDAIIGANATIMAGVKIGKNALIGAGSVVINNVPPGEVWVGNPAKYLKKKEEIDGYPAV